MAFEFLCETTTIILRKIIGSSDNSSGFGSIEVLHEENLKKHNVFD